MKQIILGTAGHIDHGKTSLIKALTGIDTDRLKEEKLRGITIELGFASLDLPGGQYIGIVDVPGHEKFVKNMVAGATGIDLVAMVIAADEGVMPQTREHMEICGLLGIKHGLIVLTKIDLVDEEWLELVTDDIRDFVQGTFLEDAPVIPVSSSNGRGIPEFTEALDRLCNQIPARPQSDLFRLPVDRVFSMKGFGTVITGSLISGKINAGDTIMIYPSEITSKVRGIQVHNKSVNQAEAGMRTAVNLQGVEKASISRGDVIANPGTLKPSYMLDVTVNFLESNEKPVKNRTRVRFHSGTSEIMGILILLNREELSPGETTQAQIRLDSPLTCIKDDRFVLRSYSPVRTIGGGLILNPIPRKHKRFRPDITEGLQSLADDEPDEIISFHVRQSGYSGVSFDDLKLMTNMTDKKLNDIISKLLSENTIIQADRESRIFVHKSIYENMKSKLLEILGNFHRANPLKGGMNKEELKSKFPPALGAKLFSLLTAKTIKGNEIVQEGDSVRLADHTVSLGSGQTDTRRKILNTYADAGLTPPFLKELGNSLKIQPDVAKDMITLLVEEGALVKIKDDFYIHSEALAGLEKKLIEYLERNKEITTPQFKDMTEASRKYVIPLIEYFDSEKVTIRIGDIRKLRKG